jgi:hypothetical protein
MPLLQLIEELMELDEKCKYTGIDILFNGEFSFYSA